MIRETDQIVLNANLVEAVALTYGSERVPVKYQKIGQNAHTPRRGSAQAAGYDVYSAIDGEIPPEKTVHFPSGIITKPELGWCLKLYNRSSLAAKNLVAILGAPMIINSDYWGIVMVLLRNFFEGKTVQSKERRLNWIGVNRTMLQNIMGPRGKIYKKQNPQLEDQEDLAAPEVKLVLA